MHEATVTAISLRKDKTAFKANLPEYGEVWLKLADSDVGKIEWKGTYDIGFTVKPAKEGGNFFDVKKIKNPSSSQVAPKPSTPALNGGPDKRLLDIGPHVGMWEKEIFLALRAGMPQTEVFSLAIDARLLARKVATANLDVGAPPAANEFGDDLENTF